MSRLELMLLCLCMGACTADTDRRIDPLVAAGLSGAGFHLVRTADDFNNRVVGHRLSGSGYRAEILPGGALSGLYVGEIFEGRWQFTDGVYCQSLTRDMSGPTHGCYHVAVKDDDIRLLPVN